MQPLSGDVGDGGAPRISVRLPRPQHDRAIELAGDGRGALSGFVRAAVADAIERAGKDPPPEPDG
jgi:hypothetical protein